MAIITTKYGHEFIVDDQDFQWLSKHKWRRSKKGYAETNIMVNGSLKFIPMHRLIFKLDPGDTRRVIHRNGNKNDNQRSNLKVAGAKYDISVYAP